MTWRDGLVQLGVLGVAAGVTGAVVSLLRLLPWRKGWSVGGYP